jgi:hypothetical protein
MAAEEKVVGWLGSTQSRLSGRIPALVAGARKRQPAQTDYS